MADARLRLLHVTAGNLFGGIERMLLTMAATRQAECTHDIAVSFAGRLARDLTAAGSPAHVIGDVRFRRPDTVWRARRSLQRVLAAARYDAVIAHAPWSCALAGPAARRAGRPLFMWAHDLPQRDGWVERLAARVPPDRFICNSAYTAEGIGRWQPGVPRSVIHPPVLPAAAATADERARLRAALGAGPATTVILLASRFEPCKGHRVLLEACGTLRGDVTVWIAGGPQRPPETAYLDELSRIAAATASRIGVKFLGERDDVPALMAAADIYCQPNVSPETFGISFVEALAAGLPVVTTACGGALEIIDDQCGILVRDAAPALVAEALQRLVDGPALRASLGAAGPAQARRVSDPHARLAEVCDVVRTYLGATAVACQ